MDDSKSAMSITDLDEDFLTEMRDRYAPVCLVFVSLLAVCTIFGCCIARGWDCLCARLRFVCSVASFIERDRKEEDERRHARVKQRALITSRNKKSVILGDEHTETETEKQEREADERLEKERKQREKEEEDEMEKELERTDPMRLKYVLAMKNIKTMKASLQKVMRCRWCVYVHSY